MRVSEIFRSIQGEGMRIGRPSIFVRLGTCNLNCLWCDTKYAQTEWNEIGVNEIAQKVLEMCLPGDNLVITGGEPMLQREQLEILVQILREHFEVIEIETNGSIEPTLELISDDKVYWNVSPKLSNSGNIQYRIPRCYILCSRSIFKFVVRTEGDIDEINTYIKMNNIPPKKVFLMPECTSKETHEKRLAISVELAKKFGYNVTPRLQILLYGNRRGV
ncbi:MAG: 7-carboxy-7-deazaguanine synthase QueE [Candidatus Nanoarchaeia archaeon]|nr:7-carboxy-7-deazaguanine synthase QueE [Candidatus Jingweiarchaeum tengchongense]